jgi:hypothetical protein
MSAEEGMPPGNGWIRQEAKSDGKKGMSSFSFQRYIGHKEPKDVETHD